jgi:succinoglycan biosynthesis protein ExoL
LSIIKAAARLWTDVDEADVVYAFGLDLLFLAWLATLWKRNGPRLVYDVADLPQKAMEGTVQGWAVRTIEGFLLSKAACLVVTSEAYLDEYFHKHYDTSGVECRVIENKLDPVETPSPGSASKSDDPPSFPLRIGYFGILRCRRSLHVLRQLAEAGDGRFQVMLRGIPRDVGDLSEMVRKTPHFQYDGPFDSPEELPDLYESVDLSWAAYYHTNQRSLMRINRFYEGCFYGVPMIGQKDTIDGQLIDDVGIGVAVDISDISITVNRLQELSRDDVSRWRENMQDLPEDCYVYTDEHEQLVNFLQ